MQNSLAISVINSANNLYGNFVKKIKSIEIIVQDVVDSQNNIFIRNFFFQNWRYVLINTSELYRVFWSVMYIH